MSLVGSACDFFFTETGGEPTSDEVLANGDLSRAILNEEATLPGVVLLLSVSVLVGRFVEPRVLDNAGLDDDDRDESKFQPELDLSFLVSQYFFDAIHWLLILLVG